MMNYRRETGHPVARIAEPSARHRGIDGWEHEVWEAETWEVGRQHQ